MVCSLKQQNSIDSTNGIKLLMLTKIESVAAIAKMRVSVIRLPTRKWYIWFWPTRLPTFKVKGREVFFC